MKINSLFDPSEKTFSFLFNKKNSIPHEDYCSLKWIQFFSLFGGLKRDLMIDDLIDGFKELSTNYYKIRLNYDDNEIYLIVVDMFKKLFTLFSRNRFDNLKKREYLDRVKELRIFPGSFAVHKFLEFEFVEKNHVNQEERDLYYDKTEKHTRLYRLDQLCHPNFEFLVWYFILPSLLFLLFLLFHFPIAHFFLGQKCP